jgi:hypothetical protein
MAIAQFNDTEDDALQGLPYDAQILYLRALRRRMDYATGEVGRKHRVSWQGLSETLYVEPQQGCADTGSPSRDRVKRAAKWLERAGLVIMRSIQAEKHLIFFLPLADMQKSAQNKPARNPPDHPTRTKASPDQDFQGKPDRSKEAQPAQYPLSDKTTSTGYITEISMGGMEGTSEKPSAEVVGHPSTSPQLALAVELRALGVDVLPLNPLLCNWISELAVTQQECREAAEVSRRYIREGVPIPAKYFDQVLRTARTKPPSGKQERRQAAYEGLTGGDGANIIELRPQTVEAG